mgnify:CR=1 FL=1|tara:strand:+ start:956 stop:1102 length:147 start_codon:yes stop_codon:yes gene_type:complete
MPKRKNKDETENLEEILISLQFILDKIAEISINIEENFTDINKTIYPK